MTHSIAVSRACAVLVTSVLLTGCVSTVRGTAVQGRPAGPLDVAPLTESRLDTLLLGADELNDIMGSTQMKVTSELDEMTDHADEVSDPDCLGAVYGAEEPVYAGTGWTAVRDEILRDEGNDHFLNQTVVLFRSADQAAEFFEASKTQWRECANSSVVETDDDRDTTWNIGDLTEVGGNVISTDVGQEGTPRVCQHAMGVVTNLVAETIACSDDISDEAESVVTTTIDYAVDEGQGA